MFVEGKKNGMGTLYNTRKGNGELTYEGEWKDDKYHGEGKEFYYGKEVSYLDYFGV